MTDRDNMGLRGNLWSSEYLECTAVPLIVTRRAIQVGRMWFALAGQKPPELPMGQFLTDDIPSTPQKHLPVSLVACARKY